MRKFLLLLATISLVTGITAAPSSALSASSVATKAKVTAPLAPTISAISSSALKKGKVNVKVTITLPASNGGSKITGSKVSAGGKSCTIEKTKTSCTIKSISNGKSLSVYANSKNIKGYGAKSARVTYAAGASAWSTSPAAPAVSVVADAPAAAPVAALTCANGGTCVVGNTGPGGGIVYYVDTTGFSCGSGFTATGSPTGGKCNYLEAAPTTGPSAWTDVERSWATGEANQAATVTGATGTAIGTGYKNSVAIVAQTGNVAATSAAVEARAYRGPNGLSDWFLPSKDELNQLYLRQTDVGGFSGRRYFWSSSQYTLQNNRAADQLFADGTLGWYVKLAPEYLRPVRAF